DLRSNSGTYGRHVSAVLTSENGEQMFIPKGFAHGYCTLEGETEVIYKVDALYEPQSEAGLIWSDPDLAIAWPVSASEIVVSEKDAALPRLADVRTQVSP